MHYQFVPAVFAPETIRQYSLDNPFITGAMTQAVCVVLMVAVSFVTRPREAEAIAPLTFSVKNLRLPADEPKRPFCKACRSGGFSSSRFTSGSTSGSGKTTLCRQTPRK